MATVRSTWTTTPVVVDGFLPPGEWTSAGVLPIPAGYLMVKNDMGSLWIALDVVGDTGNDAGTNDYFWILVDIDRNGNPTAHRDMLFGLFPNQPNRLGKWPVLGPGTTEPVSNTQVIASATRQGFGPSPNSAAPHRIWEVRLDLAEIGVDLASATAPPVVKVGVRVASSTPGFVYDYPSNAPWDFSHFEEIVLATRPDASYGALAGAVMGGVGIIPASATVINPTTGLATTDPSYRLPVTNSAFGGVLDIVANSVTVADLYNAHSARKFVVRHRYGADLAAANAAPWSHLRTSWTNYRWTGLTYVLESFGPDGSDMYPILNPALDYSIKSLLFEWSSSTMADGFHEFELDFFTAGSAPVASPGQRLTLRIDNRPPEVQVLDILHAGVSVAPCAIETMSGPTDGVQIVFRAYDPEGMLAAYSVEAQYGAGLSATIASDNYAAHSGSASWQGVTSSTTALWKPPFTCAYQFRVSASGRVTNGYTANIQYTTTFRNVTLIVPFITIKTKPILEAKPFRPLGFTGEMAVKGMTPQKLGRETLVIHR